MEKITKLASIGSSPLIAQRPSVYGYSKLANLEKIMDLLNEKNGFYALESALHVFPLGSAPGVMDIEQWNSQDLWRCDYQGLADGLLFFAEDILGYQFCINDAGISLFNPEEASLEFIADDIEGWAAAILSDYEELTAYPLAHEWQQQHGPIRPGRRLTYKVPLVLGGTNDLENVTDIDAVDVMRFRGNLWVQIKDAPPGTPIELNITD